MRLLDLLVFSLVLIALVFIISGGNLTQTKISFEATNTTTTITETPTAASPNFNYQTITLNLPAVDNEGNGVVALLKVDARPGAGRVLTDINKIFFWVDTQNSIRIAERVAENISKVNISQVDLVYDIQTNASLIEGPSAGAAITIATIAALENKKIDPEVMITGTINSDGTIGPVGGILEKAKAAKDVGAKIFLVPSGQGVQKSYKPVEKCEQIGPIQYCSTEYISEKIDISQGAGIQVKEVATVEDALKYFLK